MSWLNPFSDDFILKGVIEFLSNILSYINPFSDNFFGYKLIELLQDLLKYLFVPSEERITSLTEAVLSKFEFIDTIKDSVNSVVSVLKGVSGSPKLSINLGSTKYTDATTVYIDFGWYGPYKKYTDTIITGFVYALFIWKLFIKLPSIITGSGGDLENEKGGKI